MNTVKAAPNNAQARERRAQTVGLTYINDPHQGISRRRQGRGFSYISARGKRVNAPRTLKRIKALAIPPAWSDVSICARSNGHIQAVGTDAKGRKQYLYHQRWHAASAATKFDRMHLMAQLLPRIRRRVRKDLNARELSKNRVIASIVRLIDKANLRVGNRQYTEQHGSRGATTLSSDNVDLQGVSVSLAFTGKSGQHRELEFADKKIAKVISECADIDGQFLFCYKAADGDYHSVDSTAVNEYLHAITDESITAKDFRTWSGSVIALAELSKSAAAEMSKAQRKKTLGAAVATTAKALGNTKAVCRNSYIHPAVLAAFVTAELDAMVSQAEKLSGRKSGAELSQDERLFAAMLPALSS